METSDLFEDIDEFVDKAGLMLVDFTMKNIGRSHIIRLLVDKPERVTIKECAELSRSIKDHLDGNMLQLNYRLEVSSPGIGRLLSTEVDWERSVGRKLSVQIEDEDFIDWLEGYSEGCLKFREGRIVTADDIVRAVEVLD
ncbi:MAG: hypothetical protein K8S15_07080 [Candidatus Aegiribacteria sp.]|nr:hypothetical protein [Candidatus Aegiribacteria sp.]